MTDQDTPTHMHSVTFTLRLEIVRDALERYKTERKAATVNTPEYMLATLKIMECEAMCKDLLRE